MTDNKKTREHQLLNEVAQIYPTFPIGNIIESESPDFLVKQDAKIIGIEMVDYIRGQNIGESDQRRNKILWQKVANAAKERELNNLLTNGKRNGSVIPLR